MTAPAPATQSSPCPPHRLAVHAGGVAGLAAVGVGAVVGLALHGADQEVGDLGVCAGVDVAGHDALGVGAGHLAHRLCGVPLAVVPAGLHVAVGLVVLVAAAPDVLAGQSPGLAALQGGRGGSSRLGLGGRACCEVCNQRIARLWHSPWPAIHVRPLGKEHAQLDEHGALLAVTVPCAGLEAVGGRKLEGRGVLIGCDTLRCRQADQAADQQRKREAVLLLLPPDPAAASAAGLLMCPHAALIRPPLLLHAM